MQNEKDKFKENFISRLVKFSIDIIRLAEEINKQKHLYSISDQIIRSATSIGANVVEAKASSSRKDYTHFFEIALKSANETRYWIIIIEKIAPFVSADAHRLLAEVDEISKIIGSSILTLKGKK